MVLLKFKHYATDEIIEVEPIESEKEEMVYCKKLDKHFIVIRKNGDIHLKGTSYIGAGILKEEYSQDND